MATPTATTLGKPLRRITSSTSRNAVHRLRKATQEHVTRNPVLDQEILVAKQHAKDTIRNIKSESDMPFWILIFSSLFVTFIGFISLIPVVGWGFYMVIKLCNMILGIMAISYANHMTHSRLKSHGRLFTRIIILSLTMLFGLLFPPVNAILLNMPTLLTEAWILWSARRHRKEAIAELEKTLTLSA